MIRFDIEPVRAWSLRMLQRAWFSSVAPDLGGYVRIIAIDYKGRREQVAQPMRLEEAQRLVAVFRRQLETTAETDWLRQHHLRRLEPTRSVVERRGPRR